MEKSSPNYDSPDPTPLSTFARKLVEMKLRTLSRYFAFVLAIFIVVPMSPTVSAAELTMGEAINKQRTTYAEPAYRQGPCTGWSEGDDERRRSAG